MSSVCPERPGIEFIAAPKINDTTVTSNKTGRIALRAVFLTGSTMMPVTLAMASTPDKPGPVGKNRPLGRGHGNILDVWYYSDTERGKNKNHQYRDNGGDIAAF